MKLCTDVTKGIAADITAESVVTAGWQSTGQNGTGCGGDVADLVALEVKSLASGVEELNELVAFTTGGSGVNFGEGQVAGMGQGGEEEG